MIICIKNTEEFVILRIKSGFSQRKLAKNVGISSTYMSQIEREERNPSPKVANKIAKVLNACFDDLFFIKNVCKSEHDENVIKTSSA